MGNATEATVLLADRGSVQSRWFRRYLVPTAKVRLFCFPYAGGTARIYRNWHDWMAPDTEVVAVELPGRGINPSGPPLDRMEVLIERLLAAMDPLLDRPFGLFGHSMGALVAFELSRVLAARGYPAPLHLFVSAIEAPHAPSKGTTLHDLPDPEFIAALGHLNGAAASALANPELLQILMPVLRADFRLAETYRYPGGAPLGHPITVFGGLDDAAAPPQSLAKWQQLTRDRCVVRLLAGDHFFIHDNEHLMAASVARSLRV
jgi:medium-chain acyl-[acyl-carrier-protein] hydrolase